MNKLNFDLNRLDLKDWIFINDLLVELGKEMDLSSYCLRFLTLIRPFIPFKQGHFIFFNQENISPETYGINLNLKVFKTYQDYYSKIDDFIQNALNTPYPKRSTDIMNYDQWQKTEYFNDFHLKNDFYYVAIADVHYQSQLLCSISMVRDKKKQDFSMKELIFLKALSPHLANQIYKLQVMQKLRNIPLENIFQIVEKNQEKYQLTFREGDVAHMVIKGYNNREISDILYISEETVKKHLHSIYKKIGIQSRTELIARLLGIFEKKQLT